MSKKIMFNERFGLQQATFDGVKCMTRRVIPQCILDAVPQYQEEYYAGALEQLKKQTRFADELERNIL